ncbi:MAG TPA: hypothetical protein VFW86_02615, partial [Candidatus Limnocylindrales bacterium]|nr:hypothetical protein [Candidatus Limnocylindrales bacterium]
MILRLWSGRLLPGREAALMHRLRTAIPHVAATDVIDFTYGVRHDGDRMSFIVLSDWSDYDAVRVAAGGDPSGTVTGQTMDDLFETCQAEMYERLPPDPTPLDAGEGRVIGVVSGRVIPQHEASAQRMVDGSARAALDAGALAAHLGRRLDGELTRILVVVVWPKRSAMARFVRSREMPALDPAFTAHLVDWRFETYTMLSPERLMLPADAGPAVIVVDHEGRYVDTTPAIEAVLGVPGEVL